MLDRVEDALDTIGIRYERLDGTMNERIVVGPWIR